MSGALDGMAHRSARCLVVDRDRRVLLVRWRLDPLAARSVWFTPGGNIWSGETAVEAARRELRAQTGIVAESVGPLVMHQVVRCDELIRDEEHYIVLFTGEPASASAPLPGMDGWRWWDLSELETSTEVFHPHNVAEVLRNALTGAAHHIDNEHIVR